MVESQLFSELTKELVLFIFGVLLFSSFNKAGSALCAACRPMLQPQREDLLVDGHQGLGRTSYHNPLGRVSITRQSPEQLERGSIVHFKPPSH